MYKNGAIPHRPCGRAHSPPTWAWYEQLQPEDLESGSDYCSDSAMEDNEDEGSFNEDESGSEEDDRSDNAGGRMVTQEEDDSEEKGKTMSKHNLRLYRFKGTPTCDAKI